MGHEVTDTWVITLDTDELVTGFTTSLPSNTTITDDAGVSTIELLYGCCSEILL